MYALSCCTSSGSDLTRSNPLILQVSVPINCGMIALATRQLDDAQSALNLAGLQMPLPPFEKLLIAVLRARITPLPSYPFPPTLLLPVAS